MPTLAPTPNNRLSPGLAPVALRPSKSLFRLSAGLVVFLSLLPLAAFFSPGVDWLPAVFWLPCWWGVLGSWIWLQFRHWRKHPTALSFNGDRWFLHWQSERHAMVAIGEWVLWSWLQVLQFRDEHSGRRWSVVCLPDSASVGDRRRLRVWLNMGRWCQRHCAHER